MANIWKAGYRPIFNQISFASAGVLNSAQLDIQKTIDKDIIYGSL